MLKSARLVAIALFVTPLLALAAEDVDPIVSEVLTHSRAMKAHAGSPRGIAHLSRLHALRDQVADLNLLAQPYADVLYRRSTHPDLKRAIRLAYADLERGRGRALKAQQQLRPLGFVDQFYVLGAFDNEGKSGCELDHGPEANLDLKGVYPTRQRETTWRKLEAMSPDGYVDLAAVLRPNREAVAYALTFLEAPAETRVELSVGASGAFKLFVNGELARAEARYNQPRPDQSRVSVRLRKGHNRVLLKVCQDTGPLGFYLRQERAEGAKESARVVLPDTLPPLEKGPSIQAQPLPSATALLARELERTPEDAQLRGDYARVLDWYRDFEARDHLDLVQAEQAADAAPADVLLQLQAAELHQEDHNLRRKYLARALEADPTSPLARNALAQHELDRNHPDRALAILDPLVKDYPRFSAARLNRARAYSALEQWPRAVRETEEAFRRSPQIPIVVREAAHVARRLDRTKESIERYRVALALRFDDSGARRSLINLLTDTGRLGDAEGHLEELLKQSPLELQTRLRLAELLAANGNAHDASKHFATARTLCPDEPEVHEREGRALLQAGKREEAIAAFERSLSLRPQNPELREAVRTLRGHDQTWGVQYALEVAPLSKEADAFRGEDAIYLVDYSYTRVQPSGQSSRFHQFAVKVFTQRGVDAFRVYPITYAPARQEVQILKVRITKPDGSVVESFGDNDRAINEPWTGMYYDARARELSFQALAPGDVLELQYRLEDTARDNLLSDYWGDLDSVQTYAPKLRYRYRVDMPQARPLYWNKAKLPPGLGHEQTSPEPGRTLYSWSADNVPKVVPEPGMPGWAEVATTLHVSTYKSWEDVGRYWWGLVRDQLKPNDELRRTVDQALTGVDRKDERAVVSAIYDYVVTNTRYVALEFGIHGYKPYRVDRVLARRFGDCKDKASLIHAMLKVAGVDTRLVLLRMRSLGTIDSEPASLSAFNHAIVYVPKFDLYLDGTAAFHGANELPTADRVANVLVVEPDGSSKFSVTPEARADDNLTHLELDVALEANGAARVKGLTRITGIHAPSYRRSYQAVATRKSTFERAWGQTFPGIRVERVDMNDVSRLSEPVELGFEMEIPRYSEVLPTGLRFFPFGSGRSYAQTFASLVERSHDLVLEGPWKSTFTFRYALPAGYQPGELPADLNDETPFGRLVMTHRVEDGKLVMEGELVITVARIPAQQYPAFRAFLGRVDQAFARKALVRRVLGNGESAQR